MDSSPRIAPRRLRVLILIDTVPDRAGGAEAFAVALATHLPRDRFEVSVCATRDIAPGQLVDAMEAAEIRYWALGRRGSWDLLTMRRLATLLRRQRFDILHTHKFGSNAWGTPIGRACGVPVIVAHEHTWSYEGQPLRKLIDRFVIARLATRFVAVSTADAERMIAREKIPAEKLVVISTAYIPSKGAADRDVRAELGITPSTPLVGTAVVLRPQKAIDVLLDAHARLLRRMPETHLVIAGDGPSRAELERRAHELGLDKRVHFLGMRDDVDAILRAIDVAVLSSDFEGKPLFVLECLANRVPLVATAVGGVPEVINDGETGVLVPPRDPEALATAVAALLTDPTRRVRLAAAASERVKEFTIDAVAARFAELYGNLASELGLM